MAINDQQRKKLLMVEQILLIFTLGDVYEQYGEFAFWGFRVHVVSSTAVSWSRHALRDWLTYDNIWFVWSFFLRASFTISNKRILFSQQFIILTA